MYQDGEEGQGIRNELDLEGRCMMKVYIEGLKDLAIFVAQLAREGVTFVATFDYDKNQYEVELTGGF